MLFLATVQHKRGRKEKKIGFFFCLVGYDGSVFLEASHSDWRRGRSEFSCENRQIKSPRVPVSKNQLNFTVKFAIRSSFIISEVLKLEVLLNTEG